VDRQDLLKWLPHARDPTPEGSGPPLCLLAETPARLGADVRELADARLTGQVADRAGEELPGGTSDVSDAGEDLAILVAGRAVDAVVVPAAQPLPM
jgi:hypothetical protein